MSPDNTIGEQFRLRDAFRLPRRHEKILKKEHDFCFIERLLYIESQETEGLTWGITEFHPDNEAK
jgi:hypothetical protein